MDALITMAQLPALRRELHASQVADRVSEALPPGGGRPALPRRAEVKTGACAKAIVSAVIARMRGQWAAMAFALGASRITSTVPDTRKPVEPQ
ncbi:hypothetical protein OG589_39905 [Sphaerisporangium sp. NBC_01403]|uniref:hypothetical protein n=1 Tax=Sphaerisporangium sp. NBC_01403 TaxID=2903599 RepID=UPI003248129C